ncbi:N-acetylmuramoyl-L-alanine amidase [Nocardia transvalensis]|uniref:peptidoglycan recognition protein family protein n=1 Tax=Nocardia transvalensis TaxID=37333 RepID=UPI001894A181|nr:N-acetylmuramoyl-L-alanine amidase [Nocardia transvalensis]MBF6328725.1 N-acetylmuramoyl-L-alanine amidase [Nocardia transvalensis]
MADPVWLPEVLRAEGLSVIEYSGWRDRGHGDFGAIWGVIAHHTGNNPPTNNPGYIANHPQLGLCSQLHLSRDGVYTVCGAGIAWHAGEGSWPGLPINDANRRTIGIEAENNGREGWSPRQYDAYVRGVAAILRHLGHDASHVIGHKEWAGAAQGKWDPGGMDMDRFRADVQAAIDRKLTTPQGGTAMSWGELIKNLDGDTVSREDEIKYIDRHAGLILDQLGGPGTRRGADFPGWDFLGDRTIAEALGAIGAKLGVSGCCDPKEAKR